MNRNGKTYETCKVNTFKAKIHIFTIDVNEEPISLEYLYFPVSEKHKYIHDMKEHVMETKLTYIFIFHLHINIQRSWLNEEKKIE